MPNPRKPERVKILDGETRPSRLEGGRSPRGPVDCGYVPPPVRQHPRASEIWNRVAPSLIESGALANSDLDLFGEYCLCLAFASDASYSLIVEGLSVEQAVGNGGRRVVKHPVAQVYRDMLQHASRLAPQFGLTPASRVALDLQSDRDHDLLEDFSSENTKRQSGKLTA
jgi:P27 family predicted phage terminase small subunit